MKYNFHNNGEIYEWLGDAGDGEYIGRIDGDGDFRPANEDFENHEEYLITDARLTLGEWAKGENPNFVPPSQLFEFARFSPDVDGDWNQSMRDWNQSVKARILAELEESERHQLGL